MSHSVAAFLAVIFAAMISHLVLGMVFPLSPVSVFTAI